jgi:hypothetical protein
MFTKFTSISAGPVILLRFSRTRVRGPCILAELAVLAEGFSTERSFLIDPVIVGQFVDPLSSPQIQVDDEARIRALPICEP